jgi:hypothetical protein
LTLKAALLVRFCVSAMLRSLAEEMVPSEALPLMVAASILTPPDPAVLAAVPAAVPPARVTERRFKQSRLDERPTLGDFDWRFNPKLPRQACFELHTLKFIAEGAK